MTEIKVKVCYQVFGKKGDVFCVEPCCAVGTCYSEGKIFIPDEYKIHIGKYDIPLVELSGDLYPLADVIESNNDKPYMWNGKSNYSKIPLKFEVEKAIYYSN